MQDETCEGWSNKETWAVNLFFNNDQNAYHEATSATRSIIVETDLDKLAVTVLAEWFENFCTAAREAVFHCTTNSPSKGDLQLVEAVGSFHRVDYREVATDWVTEARLQAVNS